MLRLREAGCSRPAHLLKEFPLAALPVGLFCVWHGVVLDHASPVGRELGEGGHLARGRDVSHFPSLQGGTGEGLGHEPHLIAVWLGLAEILGKLERPVLH